MMDIADLKRIAELLELSAGTVRLFSDTGKSDGSASRISDLASQVEVIACELKAVADRMIAERK